MKKDLVNVQYASVRVKCHEACLGLGLDPVPKKTLFIILQMIFRSPITYENALPYEEEVITIRNSGKLCVGCYC